MTTAVTGASGHLGGNLVRELLAQGRSVRALARKDTRALEGLDVKVVRGNILDLDSLRELVRGADTVFHLAAKISIVGGEDAIVKKINIQGTGNIVEACLEAKVKRLVYFSSIHAFSSHPNSEEVDETRELALGDHHMAYDQSKAKAQTIVADGVKEGLHGVIVNPTAVVGPNDFKISRMGEVFLDIYYNRMPMLIDGGYNWVDARDVVQGALAAEKYGRRGECYLLPGHWVHMCELSKMIADLSGRKTPSGALPMWLALAASYINAGIAKTIGKTPKFTPRAMKSVQMHRFISGRKAAEELGYKARPFNETVRDTLRWFENYRL